ncbi:hypothetical protein EOD39_9306 [Acipenser ruthenus]|uniref:Uncharacterized protein n=1 Tax=Acipenser ruthenus TaxID=7906 RepID=A0A662YV60_ACIRT|nr:hypothetical protein EOD39_9306 [Acipenser ruthenus]
METGEGAAGTRAERAGAAALEVEVGERSPAVSCTRGAGAMSRAGGGVLPGASGSGAVTISRTTGFRPGGGGEVCTATTASTSTPESLSATKQCGPATCAPGHLVRVPGPPAVGPEDQSRAPPGTVSHLVPCSTHPEAPDVVAQSADVT